MHLPDALHLSAATQAHVGGRLHICSIINRHCSEKQSLKACATFSGDGVRGLRITVLSINNPIYNTGGVLIPLRGVLGAGAKTKPCASACSKGPAPAWATASVPGGFWRSCSAWSCRMASSRRLLRLIVTSSGSAVCWLITCSTTSPSPKGVIKHGDQGLWGMAAAKYFI